MTRPQQADPFKTDERLAATIENPILIEFRDQWSQVAPTLPSAARVYLDALNANAFSADADVVSARATLSFIAAIPDRDLSDACRYDTLTWREEPRIDGPVLICDTHGWAGQGDVYDGDPNIPAGLCQIFSRPRLRGAPRA